MAKALLDEGYHLFTTYFPLVVHGAMLIEPTETEPRRELDRFADAMIVLAERVNAGDVFQSRAAAHADAPLGRHPRRAAAEIALEARR